MLAAYDFRRVVRGQAEPELRKKHPKAYFAWPEESLKSLVPHFDTAKIGIPQGNALSPIVANIVLDYADRAVAKAVGPTNNLFYSRYCDDIIIISPSLWLAQKAWKAYVGALRELQLPAHPCNRPLGKHAKSRQPYRWAKGADEWVDYVGYRIRCDGQTRIRESSEQKHRGKIMATVDQFLRAIEKEKANTKGRRPANASYSLRRLIRHLVASATGRQPPWGTQARPSGLCWIAGFEHQMPNPSLLKQLRGLDRFRHSQIHFAAKRLQKILRLRHIPGKGRLSQKYRFIGYPLSYC
ncbi:MAG: reverse transcriptase domain-containing protein [Chthoniobacteraceae bacterium]